MSACNTNVTVNYRELNYLCGVFIHPIKVKLWLACENTMPITDLHHDDPTQSMMNRVLYPCP